MIYTIDRETPDHDLKKAAHEELDRIAELVKEANIPVSVSYWNWNRNMNEQSDNTELRKSILSLWV